MIGITAIGTHIPRLRLRREIAVAAMSWYAPFLGALKKGYRSVCNYDEDAVTLAVAAGRRVIDRDEPSRIGALYLAGTTLPFAARQSAALVKTALGLPDRLFTADITDTERAGLTALIAAADRTAHTGEDGVVIAADHRVARPGAPEELLFGDGAAAVRVGQEGVIAAIEGRFSLTRDLVDHYRGSGARFDYNWEERWTAAVGYERLIPEVVTGLLSECDTPLTAVDHFVYPCPSSRTHGAIGRSLGVPGERIAGNLFETVGETGTAHPLVMLAAVLETAAPGDRIVVVGFGGGADGVLLRVTDAIDDRRPVVDSHPTADLPEYTRFLAFRDLIAPEEGIRGEKPQKTALSVLYRERELLTGLVGGRCEACGTPQIPKGPICVNPDCRKPDTLVSYRFADRSAQLKTFTGDFLGPSPAPPNIYGLIQFDGGGRMMAELTDCSLEELRVGTPLAMSFRKRYTDSARTFTGYFWKAVPRQETQP